MSDFINRPQIEVLSAADGERRRYWSDDDKLRIVEDSFIGDRQAAATARRHGICRSLLTTWRRQYRNGELGSSRAVSFAPEAYTAIAAKMARTVHAVVKHGEPYRPFFEGVSPGGRTTL